MIKVFTTRDMVEFNYAKSLLRDKGIPFLVKNEDPVGAAAGEVPPIVSWPELWVPEGEAGIRALNLLLPLRSESQGEDEPWTCDKCGEHLDPPFAACWRCGADRPRSGVWNP